MPYSYKEISKKLKKEGYSLLRMGKGSHVVFGKENSRIIVPHHGGKDISPGVEKQILKILGKTKEEFRRI